MHESIQHHKQVFFLQFGPLKKSKSIFDEQKIVKPEVTHVAQDRRSNPAD